jgi:hypothetical protein
VTTTFVLIITLFGYTSQSGKAIATQEFFSHATCEAAKTAWLASVPKDAQNSPVSAFCIQK